MELVQKEKRTVDRPWKPFAFYTRVLTASSARYLLNMPKEKFVLVLLDHYDASKIIIVFILEIEY